MRASVQLRRLCAALLVFFTASASVAQIAENVGDPEPPPVTSSAPPSPLWVAPLATLYDNGPLVTHSGVCPGPADASRLQNTSLGLNSLGFNVSLSGGFRMADDFTVPPGGWYVNTATFLPIRPARRRPQPSTT